MDPARMVFLKVGSAAVILRNALATNQWRGR